MIVQTSGYGKVIPVLYGQCRFAGNVIWSLPIREHEHNNTIVTGGGKGGSRSITTVSYSYAVTLAIAICEGEIDNILNIWADAKLLAISDWCNFRFYQGDEQQMPDPLIEAHMGMGKTPAYRGISYIVIEDFPLAAYGNRIPNFTFEVKRRSKIIHNQLLAVEDLVKAICIIPGSGEFVYDTIAQYKIDGEGVQQGKAVAINQHSQEGKVDAVLSLDQMQDTCPNIEWVAVIVSWFATSIDIAFCKIIPGVEFRQMTTQPDTWKVAAYTRETAHLINSQNGKPVYGGSVADISVLRYLQMLKDRGFKIMFYPMIFIDLPGKPWRGHLTGEIDQIEHFFNFVQGYNQFIMHYANLVKDKVDAFIIGSELVGLTRLKNDSNHFPVVEKLCELAKSVKQALGLQTQVTYAADWSEYHHTDGGWYNLDQLWACEFIDFIGIDAYFPLSADKIQQYDEQQIIDGWTSGEGYDFYYLDKNHENKVKISPEYAWKNIKYWWENEHINPDKQKTRWQPKSKKIWFTEFGFSSLDCAANQPNVFYDPESYDGGLPFNSRGRVDLRAQRVGIAATLRKWADSEMITQMFLWCWDARPYPYWPYLTDIWADGELWQRGHWVNGKFGACRLGDIIAELCYKSGLLSEQFDVTQLTDIVDGYVVNEQMTGRAIVENLSKAYFFDIVESEYKLRFISRRGKQVQKIIDQDLVSFKNGGTLMIIRQQELELAQKFALLYLDKALGYQPNIAYATRNEVNSYEAVIFDSRLVLTSHQAELIANLTLYQQWLVRTSYQFMLPPVYFYLEPGDVVSLQQHDLNHQIRITNITLGAQRMLKITGVAENIDFYDFYFEPIAHKIAFSSFIPCDYIVYVLDLPAHFFSERDETFAHIAVANKLGVFKRANIYYTDDSEYKYYGDISSEATIGTVVERLLPSVAEVIDFNSKLTVILLSGQLESISNDRLFAGENIALIGDEIIQFANAKLIEPGKYELSGLLRGRMGTEYLIPSHQAKERFILLDNKLKKISLPGYWQGAGIRFKITGEGQDLADVDAVNFVWLANSLKPYNAPLKPNQKNLVNPN